jgi:hypothetical protein
MKPISPMRSQIGRLAKIKRLFPRRGLGSAVLNDPLPDEEVLAAWGRKSLGPLPLPAAKLPVTPARIPQPASRPKEAATP